MLTRFDSVPFTAALASSSSVAKPKSLWRTNMIPSSKACLDIWSGAPLANTCVMSVLNLSCDAMGEEELSGCLSGITEGPIKSKGSNLTGTTNGGPEGLTPAFGAAAAAAEASIHAVAVDAGMPAGRCSAVAAALVSDRCSRDCSCWARTTLDSEDTAELTPCNKSSVLLSSFNPVTFCMQQARQAFHVSSLAPTRPQLII